MGYLRSNLRAIYRQALRRANSGVSAADILYDVSKLISIGKWKTALSICHEGTQKFPDNVQLWQTLAELGARRYFNTPHTAQLDRVLMTFETAYALAPEDEGFKNKFFDFLTQGTTHYRAEQRLLTRMATEETNPADLTLLGDVYKNWEKPDLARTCYGLAYTLSANERVKEKLTEIEKSTNKVYTKRDGLLLQERLSTVLPQNEPSAAPA